MKKPATILYIDNSFTFGGAIISLRTTIDALNKEKFRPVLITAQSSSYLAMHFSDIHWFHLNMRLPRIHNRHHQKISESRFFRKRAFLKKMIDKIRSVFWMICFILPEALRIYRIGRKQGTGLVHLNNALGGQLSGIIAAKLLGVPCVAHLRDYEQPCHSARIHAGWVDHHIAISESVKNNLLALGVGPEKISIVYDSVDLAAFSQKTNANGLFRDLCVDGQQLLIGWFGRIIEWKGVREFVLCISELKQKFNDFQVIVVGDASDSATAYEQEVKALVQDLGLEKTIIFAGYRQEVIPIMNMMDIIVHTSITPEPFGMVIIEAMACSKPVVASSVGGGPLEIVKPGETGFLADPKKPREMSAALLALLTDRKLRNRFGNSGRKRVESLFASPVHIQQIEEIYRKFLQ
ncbi:MAG: glycosyltransferase family 4 protein [Desulfobacterales bacterium]|nr:glycosyltransferase family 4 protein [Desulfobacterales bacterium]